MQNANLPKGLYFCNAESAKTTLPAPETIPNLVRDEVLTALLKNDGDNPRYVVEAIDFPVEGSGGIYTKKFFQSFLDRMKEHPFGGNKLGHSYPEKNDFYTVGGMIEESGKGKGDHTDAGTVYLKMFIPQMGYETSNAGFIRDLDAKNVHFFLVTRPDFVDELDGDTRERKRYMVASLDSERNDAVAYQGGAMDQRVNGAGVVDYEQAKALVRQGQVNYTDVIEGEEVIHNGVVYRSVLRRIAARANGGKGCAPEVKELLSLIDRSKNNRSKPMERNELLEQLSGLYENGVVRLSDLAKELNFADRMRSDQDNKNAETVRQLNAKLGEAWQEEVTRLQTFERQINSRLGDKPLEAMDKLLATEAETRRLLAENAVTRMVGPEKIRNGRGEEVVNPRYIRAMELCNGKTGEELKAAINSLGSDPLFKHLSEEQADIHSEFNRVIPGGATAANSADGAHVVEA